jgi:uncharacterized surface protein with fasciclin (FAS1) repeats
LVSVAATIEKLGLTKLKDALESVGLSDVLTTQNVTIFAPSDEAMTRFEEQEVRRWDTVLATSLIIYLDRLVIASL